MNLSLIIRRTHMYLALFLAPWVLMYALSTMAMNHRDAIRELYGGEPAVWAPEKETTYDGTFPADVDRRVVAEQILSHLDMEGTYYVRHDRETGRYTIDREAAITPRRVIFDPAAKTLAIERLEFRTSRFLEEMHRRRGFGQWRWLDNVWAFSVDLVIVAMVFWAASGLWMWWELRVTRMWGALFAVTGAALFTLFLVTI